MRTELAERVLANVMDWDAEELNKRGPQLQVLASHKYDSYDGYRPGVKFLESLTGWLHQFDPEERRVAVDFVLRDLIFISRAELAHLIETVYPDHIRPMLIARAAERLEVSRFAVKKVVESNEFHHLQRRTLILGLSDGAHIDQLRRASHPLSHEQIFLATDIGDKTIRDAIDKLRKATDDPQACFEQVLLVDDFYGSGQTLLRKEEDGSFNGRLWRTHQRLQELTVGGERPNGDEERPVALAPEFRVSTLIYMASTQAIDHVESALQEAGLAWDFHVVQPFPDTIRVTDVAIKNLCEWHYDGDVFTDKHKGVAVLGFTGCALPLVLQHNTPNNSICILWADSTDRPQSLKRRALFPRYERHREDRQ